MLTVCCLDVKVKLFLFVQNKAQQTWCKPVCVYWVCPVTRRVAGPLWGEGAGPLRGPGATQSREAVRVMPLTSNREMCALITSCLRFNDILRAGDLAE